MDFEEYIKTFLERSPSILYIQSKLKNLPEYLHSLGFKGSIQNGSGRFKNGEHEIILESKMFGAMERWCGMQLSSIIFCPETLLDMDMHELLWFRTRVRGENIRPYEPKTFIISYQMSYENWKIPDQKKFEIFPM